MRVIHKKVLCNSGRQSFVIVEMHGTMSAKMALFINTFFRQFAIVVLVALSFPAVSFAAATAVVASDCAILSGNLKVGMSGEGVRILQVLLNDDLKTRVSDTGLGASGMETTYFGVKTHTAVIKFQELYKEEVLLPAGLTAGSGFVGSYTRAKLLKLCASRVEEKLLIPPTAPKAAPIPSENINTSSATTSISDSGAPQLNRPSNYVVSPGERVSVSGAGFASSGNILHVGLLTFSGLAPNTLGLLEVVVPTDATKGKFDLSVSNVNGESNKSFLIIVDKGTLPPSIKSLSPDRGANGTLVSVIGDQFTKENNEIYFGAKPVLGIPSIDGTSLTFTLSMGIDGMPLGQSGTSTATDPMWFYVVNANGISNNGIFTLTF